MSYQLRVTVLGEEFTKETNYGPRTERPTVATLDVEVDSEVAYSVYGAAFRAVTTAPWVRDFTAEQAEVVRKQWQEPMR